MKYESENSIKIDNKSYILKKSLTIKIRIQYFFLLQNESLGMRDGSKDV